MLFSICGPFSVFDKMRSGEMLHDARRRLSPYFFKTASAVFRNSNGSAVAFRYVLLKIAIPFTKLTEINLCFFLSRNKTIMRSTSFVVLHSVDRVSVILLERIHCSTGSLVFALQTRPCLARRWCISVKARLFSAILRDS